MLGSARSYSDIRVTSSTMTSFLVVLDRRLNGHRSTSVGRSFRRQLHAVDRRWILLQYYSELAVEHPLMTTSCNTVLQTRSLRYNRLYCTAIFEYHIRTSLNMAKITYFVSSKSVCRVPFKSRLSVIVSSHACEAIAFQTSHEWWLPDKWFDCCLRRARGGWTYKWPSGIISIRKFDFGMDCN